jgi:hypothetical protein
MIVELHLEIERLLPVLEEVVVPQIKESFFEVSEKWKAFQYHNNFTFGCNFKTDLTLRLRDNERLFEGVYSLARVRNAPFLDFLTLQMSYHRVDPRTGVPKGGKLVKECAKLMGMGLPKQMRFAVIKGEARFCPEPPRNVVLGIDAHPDYGLRQVFVGILLPSGRNPDRFEYPRKFIIYSSIPSETIEPVAPEKEVSPVVSVEEKPLPPQEKEPGIVVHLDRHRSAGRNAGDDEK